MRFIFMGSTEFGIPSLKKLCEAGHCLCAIITTPPAPKGRGQVVQPSIVQSFISDFHHCPVLTPVSLSDPAFISMLDQFAADVFIVIAFRILPPSVFTLPRFGALNVHASLLPKYRGAAPIQRAIAAGESESGVTVFRIGKGIDTGEILCQKSTPIQSQETSVELSIRLSLLGADAMLETCQKLESGTAVALPQQSEHVSYAPKLLKHEGLIDWNQPASILFNRLRAFKPFPGTFTHIGNHRLAIEWAQPLDLSTEDEPGTVCSMGADFFDVSCGQGILRILSVKPEGKKVMSSRSFLNGTNLQKGIKFS